MNRSYRVRWDELVTRLRARSGLPVAWIARRVAGMDERTLHRVARGEGVEPKFSQGMALLDYAVEWLSAEDWRAVRGGAA